MVGFILVLDIKAYTLEKNKKNGLIVESVFINQKIPDLNPFTNYHFSVYDPNHKLNNANRDWLRYAKLT